MADSWNGHAWDEFIIIDLFTPDGLNELDANTAYSGVAGFSQAGIRMYHVDARLCKMTGYNSSGGYYVSSEYATDTQVKNGTLNLSSSSYWYDVAARNSAGGDASFIQGKGYELIAMMSARNKSFTDSSIATNSDLFKVGDSLNLTTTGYLSSGKLNNGNYLKYNIEIEELSSSSSTIKFTKLG